MPLFPRTTLIAAVAGVCVLAAACTRTVPDGEEPVERSGPTTTIRYRDAPPCSGPDGLSATPPPGSGPGDLVDAEPIDDAASEGSPGFPGDARVWRILYVSTVADGGDLQLVCGLVAAPRSGPTVDGDGVARVLSWAHGTIGLQQACLPSSDPATFFWGPMRGGGIGAVSWGSGSQTREGRAADGLLRYALGRGWAVVASDYRPVDTYLVGRVAAANVLDANRAAAQLLDRSHPGTDVERWDTVIAGHSQGGHAAAWAGQLHDAYLAATTPSEPVAPSRLVGVVMEAPAANFVVQPDRQPGLSLGDGLADREMFQLIDAVGRGIPQLDLPIGPALFSYIFGAWAQLSARGAPDPADPLPAFPADDTGLRLGDIATPQGVTTIEAVTRLCLTGRDALRVLVAVQPYQDADRNRMLVPDLWDLPADYRPREYAIGGTDRTCATDPGGGLGAWCRWIRWNLPGPLGVHPMPKVPTSDGGPVPMLIAQGTDDQVVHCQPSAGAPQADVPPPSTCVSSALVDALASEVCPADGPRGSLAHVVFPATGPSSPGTHFSVPGQLASRGPGTTAEDLTVEGSRLERFLTGAFAGTLPAGCTQTAVVPD
jgi:hypothetical protein